MILKDIINAELTRSHLTGSHPDHNYPSSASFRDEQIHLGTCLRSSWYYRKRIPVTNTNGVPMIMRQELGKLVETMYIDIAKQAGILDCSKVKFFDPIFKLSGELDLVVRDPETHELILWEQKSAYGYYAAKEIEGTRTTDPKPKDINLLQTAIYLYYFRDRINLAKIYYLARDTGHETVFDIRLQKEGDKTNILYGIEGGELRPYPKVYLEGILERYLILNKFVDANIAPSREYKYKYNDQEIESLFKEGEISKTEYTEWKKNSDERNRPGHWSCNYCNYRSTCLQDLLTKPGFSWSTYQAEKYFESPDEMLTLLGN